jgi:beta-galactosidase/beta-glucuronidase
VVAHRPRRTAALYAYGEHWSGRIGLRTVELDTSPDDVGRKFVIKVNGKPIWCKGFNWIPDDCFLDRACTPERYRARLQQAIDANANMLRVWGGGIYETDAFYDLCDQMGILVWQDCLFACAAYPEEEPFRSLVEQELRHNVSRLARHASLVLWNGCNENLWGFYVWGQFKPLHDGTRTWGAGYYFDLIPRVLRELDPSRPYWPASPFSGEWVDAAVGTPMPPLQDPCSTSFPPVPLAAGDQTTGAGKKPVLRPRRWDVDACAFVDGPLEALTGVSSDPLAKERTPTGLHPNAASHGNKHVWEVWDAPYEVYRKFAPRFCSEFGFQAPATYATIARVTPPDQRRLDSDVMLQHQKSPTWLVSTAKRVKEVFGDGIDDFDDQHYLLQVNQARALQLGVEWFRTRRECSGTLYWQLNDCWPVTSWAAVDGDGRPKPLWYATRRFYAGRLLTIQPTGYDAPPGDPLTLFAVNDTDEPWAGEAAVTLYDMTTGAAVGVPFTTALSAGPRATASVTIALPQPADPSRQVLVANVGPHRAFWYFGPDKQLAYPAPRVEAQLQRRGDEHVLTLTAETFVRDLCVFADRLDPDAVVSDQLLTLLPGETRTLNITSARDLTLAGLTSRPVLRTVNDFGRRG